MLGWLLTISLSWSQQTDITTQGEFNLSRLLVKHAKTAKDEDIKAFHDSHQSKAKKFKRLNWSVVELDDNDREKKVKAYQDSPLFEKVQFDKVYHIDDTVPNDPRFSEQWGPIKIEAPAAWDTIRNNDSVVVAVIDTGIDFDHPDLKANLWTGPAGEHGYTAINGALNAGGRDDHFHGTHVAGTIGAVGNNGIGVVGLNWVIKIISFKFLNSQGGGLGSDAILCLEKIVDLKQAGLNIRVSNNSWGGLGRDEALEDAFLDAENNGVINACAAGNNGIDIDETDFFPASAENTGIVSVQASGQNDNKALFSNYGVIGTDILAPGVSILSCKLGGDYWLLSGTSMASPHVAGALALLLARNPNLTVDQAKSVLLDPDSYDRTPFVESSTGGGRLNLRKLVTNPKVFNPPPPNHPPVITIDSPTNFLVLDAGQSKTFHISGSDPDGDSLIFKIGGSVVNWPYLPQYWTRTLSHFGTLDLLTNVVTWDAWPLAVDSFFQMRFKATDGRGGGARANQSIYTYRVENLVRDLRPAIKAFNFWFDSLGKPRFRLDWDTTIAPPPPLGYSIEVSPHSDVSPWGDYGQEVNVEYESHMDFLKAGSYVVRAFVSDTNGNFATSPGAVVKVGGSTYTPPDVRIAFNTTRGPAPLEVVADMRPTLLNSATSPYYYVLQWEEGGINVDVYNPIRKFTLPTPGTYWFRFYVTDSARNLTDKIIQVITVLPPGSTNAPPPPPPPVPELVQVNDLRFSLVGRQINLAWTDRSNGEDRYELGFRSRWHGPWRTFQTTTLAANTGSYSLVGQSNYRYQFRVRSAYGQTFAHWSAIVETPRIP